ncbi:hypothetical protein KP509_08G043000 [Ceratopteris richardii]|nr:hypothetical protein KP509_08G043000 [Ceratopteris richardii]
MMVPVERNDHFFQRVVSDSGDTLARWAYPYRRPSADWEQNPAVPANRNRSRSSGHLFNLPVDQQPQQTLMNAKQWMRHIAEEIDQAYRPVFVKRRTIFSVPRALFEVRPRAYCPRIVTIGPLCRKLEPSPMDSCKALCIREFMKRHDLQLDMLMDILVKNSEDLRNIYFNLPKYSTEALKLLLTLDTVFLHEYLFFMTKDYNPDDESCGYLFSFINNQITNSQLTRDLFLIGNQVPMVFLRRLAELPNEEFPIDIMKLCLEYLLWRSNPFCISHMNSSDQHEDIMNMIGEVSVLDCEHLLDCLYTACVQVPDGHFQRVFNRPSCRLPTASALTRVGIKFKARKGNTSVIKYRKKSLILELPRLVVFDETEDILRNLIAYELTSKEGCELCGYAVIMDSLIDTADDLAILEKVSVLENHLGSDERLLRMWNEMCINISESSFEKWEVMTEAILKHYKSHWRVMYNEFYSKFFSRPWLLLSTIAAALLLAMSALQTAYSVAAYYQGG